MELQELCSKDSEAKMESDISSECDEDLLEKQLENILNENVKDAENFAKELIQNRAKIGLQSVLDTETLNVGIIKVVELKDEIGAVKVNATQESSRELNSQSQINTGLELDLCTSSVDDHNESLEELLDEQMLNEKMKAAEEFGRKLKLRNLTNTAPQCVPSVSGAVGGTLDVHELLGDYRKEVDEKSREQTLDKLNKALSSNLQMQAFLFKWENSVLEALEKNLKLQELLAKSKHQKGPTKAVKQWTIYTTLVFGMPYFKEKNKKMSCPLNGEAKLRIQSGHPLTSNRYDSGKWTVRETALLKSCVRTTLMDKIVAKLSIERDEIKKANENKTKSCISKAKKQIDRINKTIKNVKTMSLKELMSEEEIDNDYDWQAFSLNTFKGYRSQGECQSYWELCLDPTRNHSSWEKEEEEKLLALAEKYSSQDWDKIAIELGTNRSAYECCLHFERELDRNVRSTGKWTLEEDNRLIEAVKKFRVGNHIPWTKISFAFTQRSVAQLRARWTESLAPHRKKGRFTPDEDRIIFESIEKHGYSFGAVASMFRDRTAPQIRGRFQRKMCQIQIKGRWTLEEDKLLMDLVERIGIPKWKEISEHFVTRTRTQVRQRYNAIKSFLERFPTLGIEDIIRRSIKSRGKASEITSKIETISSHNKSTINREPGKEITNPSNISEDVARKDENKRKRKSTVSESSTVDDNTPRKQTKISNNTRSNVASSSNTRSNQTIAFNNETIANIEPEKEITDPDTFEELARKDENKRRRKSTVSESSIVDDSTAQKQTKKSNNTDNRIDTIMKLLRRKREAKELSPAGKKLTNYFQETYPMHALLGKKSWADTDISSEAKVIFELSQILKVDFSYTEDLSRLKSVEPFMLRQTVKKLIEIHGDALMRLNPVNPKHNNSPSPLLSQANSETDGIFARNSVTENTISDIDCPPPVVEETLCTDLFPDDFINEDQPQDFQPFNIHTELNSNSELQQNLDLVEKRKRHFMDFPYLIPGNVATTVGYRSLLLIERKLKSLARGEMDGNDETLPPDYTSNQFRLKDEEKVLAKFDVNNKFEMKKCVRFTRDEAIHMFKERLKILFAVPIVLSETADRYFDATYLPIYKKESNESRVKRRTFAHFYENLHQSKMSSKMNANPIELETDDVGCEASTVTPYSMPSLEDCNPSTSSTAENCNLETSNSENCNPSTSTSCNLRESISTSVMRQYPTRRETRPVKTNK